MAAQAYAFGSHAEVPVMIYKRPPVVTEYRTTPVRIVGRPTEFDSPQHIIAGSIIPRDTSSSHILKSSGSNNDEDFGGGSRAMPSTMAQDLADDIEMLEGKYNQLEERNAWLTKKLLQTHSSLVERALSGSAKGILRRSLDAWREALQELVLERELEEHTRSLEQCQQVAQELGSALAQEQQAKKMCEAENLQIQDDLQRAILQEKRLKEQFKEQQFHVEILEKRVHEAEACIARSRADAEAVVERSTEYDVRRRQLESSPETDDNSRRRHAPTILEHGFRRLTDDSRDGLRNSSGYQLRLPTQPPSRP